MNEELESRSTAFCYVNSSQTAKGIRTSLKGPVTDFIQEQSSFFSEALICKNNFVYFQLRIQRHTMHVSAQVYELKEGRESKALIIFSSTHMRLVTWRRF